MSKNQYNNPSAPKKKGKKWPWIVGAVAVLGLAGACNTEADDTTPTSTESVVITTSQNATANDAEPVREEPAVVAEPEQPAEPEVSREYEQALKKAESYLRYSHFSEKGLFDQLTSEYADSFPAEAAQYAVDNVEVDWNAEAVEAAESYLEYSEFSSSGLYDQLVSEYGEGFTHEEAEYAVSLVY